MLSVMTVTLMMLLVMLLHLKDRCFSDYKASESVGAEIEDVNFFFMPESGRGLTEAEKAATRAAFEAYRLKLGAEDAA